MVQRKIRDLIDEENKVLGGKGLRWHVPNCFDTIELHTDFKFFGNKPALDDEEIMWKDSELSKEGKGIYWSKTAINEEEGVSWRGFDENFVTFGIEKITRKLFGRS